MTSRFAGALALTAAAWLGAEPALAQTPGGGIALNQLDPAPAGDVSFGVPSPSAAGHLVPRAFVMFDYAARPLSITTGETTSAVVSDQGFLALNASLALFDRLLVSAFFPVAILQRGDSPKVSGIAFPSPSSAQVGDLRLGARVRLLGDDGAPFQAAVGASFHFPTSPAGAFTGESTVRIAPHLALGGRVSRVVWNASLGAVVRGSDNPSTLTYGVGAAVLLLGDALQVGPEVFAATPLQEGFINLNAARSISRGRTTNAELLVGARVRVFSSLCVGIAAGPGLSDAIGTPVFRVLSTAGWSPLAQRRDEVETRSVDPDEDGEIGSEDACPYTFGAKSADPKRNGCPVVDRDEDGVPDPEDACPDDRGGADGDPGRRGCPADRDGDGVPDMLDACPDQKGSAEMNGCPAKGDAAAGKK
jgi:OmpA-OmpF porin, OOP family